MKLYIDPGTGSMLVIGLASVIWFGARKLFLKMKPSARHRDGSVRNTFRYRFPEIASGATNPV